ncbi:MAG: tyrosine decarboxylase MfnA [Promethearchaeota archaeon Loki_b32]|nr:MAG: tyrosine decarboxylase MfnA [Candidatus Lokiarchaeota archaeon Loki_b32]
MQEKGLEKQEILRILEKKLEKDFSYSTGSVLGSMCTEPLDLGVEIYMKYISKNLGDPGLFLGTAALEEELVSEIGKLFNEKNIIGTFTTGGSEANLIAMRIAKKLRPDIKSPEVVVPCSAHISFDKAADLLGIKLRKATLNDNFELNLTHFESLINRNTCGVVGIAGTTSLGLIDPIEEIGTLIKDKDIFFHIDAAFGGFILPFLKKLNYTIPAWDFSVNAVDSITADPHKMGLGIIPSGGFFLRDPSILQKIGFEIPYLAGGNFKHFHIVGTRSGGTVIAFWAILKSLGFNGFVKIVKRCMDNTKYLSSQINDITGIKLVTNPVTNVVGITTESGESICKIDEDLRKRNWMLGKFEEFNLIRVVIMPHVQKSHLQNFIEDLTKIIKKLKIT